MMITINSFVGRHETSDVTVTVTHVTGLQRSAINVFTDGCSSLSSQKLAWHTSHTPCISQFFLVARIDWLRLHKLICPLLGVCFDSPSDASTYWFNIIDVMLWLFWLHRNHNLLWSHVTCSASNHSVCLFVCSRIASHLDSVAAIACHTLCVCLTLESRDWWRGSVWATIMMSKDVPTMRINALQGVDVYAADATIESVFGDLKGRMLLEAIWNVYQAHHIGFHTEQSSTIYVYVCFFICIISVISYITTIKVCWCTHSSSRFSSSSFHCSYVNVCVLVNPCQTTCQINLITLNYNKHTCAILSSWI